MMINSLCYVKLPCDKLKAAVWSQYQGQLSKDVALLRDSADPHTAAQNVETL
jgi:hypothetical protein